MWRRYLNRPEETAKAFLPDPFAGTARRPLYRTKLDCDAPAATPTARFVFLGRCRSTVKRRGFASS